MGLDMYLIKRRKNDAKDNSFNEVAYWRKANQIHKWFVDHVQDGVDDCGYYKVSVEQLRDLLATCRDVINMANTTQEEMDGGLEKIDGEWKQTKMMGRIIHNEDEIAAILPTGAGFFFGSTEYNEWYLRDIEETIEQLEEVLFSTDFTKDEILYTSSW